MKTRKIMDKILFRTAGDAVVEAKSKDSRRITFIASDSTRDSHGTVLNQEGWSLDRFNKNGIIGYQHKVYGGWDDTENPDNVIGKGKAYTKDGKLYVDVDFEPKEINELADKIYNKLLFGSLKAVSVGFLPKGKGSWGKGEEALDGKTRPITMPDRSCSRSPWSISLRTRTLSRSPSRRRRRRWPNCGGWMTLRRCQRMTWRLWRWRLRSKGN